MFRNAIRLPFKILGIPVLLDLSFLLFLPLLAWMIGSQLPAIVEILGLDLDVSSIATGSSQYLVGFGAALGLFLSVLIHEVGHSVVARFYGVKVQSITLWILGGMAKMDDLPRLRGVEAIIAIAGPITSALLAGGGWILYRSMPDAGVGFQVIVGYLAAMNGLLAVFNLLPALPLDGGRVLRSLLALRMPFLQATQVSGSVSKVIAFGLGFLGFLQFNLLLLLVAFFVYAAGHAEALTVTATESLRGLRVMDLMTRDVHKIYEHLPVADLLEKMLNERYLGYPVVDLSEQVVGMASLSDVKRSRMEGKDPQRARVADVMRRVATLRDTDPAAEAFRRLVELRADRLAVLDSGDRLVGIISNTDLVRTVQITLEEQSSRPPGPLEDAPQA